MVVVREGRVTLGEASGDLIIVCEYGVDEEDGNEDEGWVGKKRRGKQRQRWRNKNAPNNPDLGGGEAGRGVAGVAATGAGASSGFAVIIITYKQPHSTAQTDIESDTYVSIGPKQATQASAVLGQELVRVPVRLI